MSQDIAQSEFTGLPDDELSAEFVAMLIDRILEFMPVLVGYPLHSYQTPFARRIIESVVVNDGEELTGIASRQSGKSELIANTVATLMVILPKLAVVYPELLGKFAGGVWVGLFAPVEGQVETLFQRVHSRLTSERAQEVLADPEIDDAASRPTGIVKTLTLKSGSLVSMMTANPRAKIESRTFHLIIIDECFPYETPILTSDGYVPIGEIVTGPRRDWVVATQSSDDCVEWANVSRAYRTPRHTDLVRVDHDHGSIYCTANHPFIVGSEEVPAIDLCEGAVLSLVQEEPDQPPRTDGLSGVLRPHLLTEVLGRNEELAAKNIHKSEEAEPGSISEHDQEQPDAQSRGSGQDDSHLEEDWSPPQGAGREWSRDDRSAAEALGRATRRLGGRACSPYWAAGAGGTPVTLQAGPGERGVHDSSGGGREITPRTEPTRVGQAQGLVLAESRVVGVEVLEQGSPEFDQFSDGADYVYTIEVNHPSHCYFAAGIAVGNCQGADDRIVARSISPMLAYNLGTLVKCGTPSTVKNNFYKSIQRNKRRQSARSKNQFHFQWDWKDVSKVNPDYGRFVKKEMLRIGEDSDEFMISYQCRWILERGMFVSETVMDELADRSMEIVKHWHKSPVVVGIDPARKLDSTVVTVLWVDWDRPDEFGYFEHRVLNWLEITGEDWEKQYAEIVDFLSNYDVYSVGVDTNGVGDAVAQRLALLMPRTQVIPFTSSVKEQSGRFKHLQALIQRRMIGWPGHSRTRRLRVWKRFMQQMVDAERQYVGANFIVAAPNEAYSHDDHVDALAIAAALTIDETMPTLEVSQNPFF